VVAIKANKIEDSGLSDIFFNEERREKQPFLMQLFLDDYLKMLLEINSLGAFSM
jgi:hypothetical protein